MTSIPALVLAVCATAFAASPIHAAELVVGAPSALAGCVDALSSAFAATEQGARVRFVVDTDQNLYQQVSAGKPIDVHMSTDMRLQGQLLADGKMVYDSWTMYATGRIALWSVDRRFDVTKGLRLLADPAVKKIAVVDAGSAYMAPTNAALHHAGLADKIAPRLLDRESMQDVVAAVRAGKAQVGIVSYETVLAAPMKGGKYYVIPESEYKDDVPGHAAVVTPRGAANPLARRFVRFLTTPGAQAILVSKGFMKPPADKVDVR